MKLIHIVGSQGSGKTTLIIELLKEFNKRDISVGTLKHSPHSYELDTPGKDSFRHRTAGGIPAAVATKNQIAVYLPRKENENPLDKLAVLFDETDLIIIEGYINGPGKKIEVWRKKTDQEPFFMKRPDIKVVITDDYIDTSLTVWPRNNIGKIADNILTLAGK